jgi:hypothetical protein
LNRSSRNWSTSDACDGTRTRLTCDANLKKKKMKNRDGQRGRTNICEREREQKSRRVTRRPREKLEACSCL